MPVRPEDVDLYEKLQPQLKTLLSEMSILSKSKPNDSLNKFKLLHVNQLLADANSLLTDQHQPLKGFTQFDDAEMPSNSDVVLVLSQFLEGLEGWRSSNVKLVVGYWYWDTTGRMAEIKAHQPTRFRRGNDV